MTTINRPVQIEEFVLAIRELPTESLDAIKSQLSTSVHRLNESNKLMESLLLKIRNKDKSASEIDELEDIVTEEDDDKIYEESIRENEIVLKNQKERIDRIEQELLSRSTERKEDVPTASSSAKFELNTDNNGIESNAANSVFL
ncbi:BA75_03434T0 [Komagataella pastoris]|uniref:BA75_03434T0 n=1 Tax=Komagataella pastoris TaxID=4922 RepID=A0A1B2JGL9_PICPA|nr:BA75_03434T0 [Komagataella pastoris]